MRWPVKRLILRWAFSLKAHVASALAVCPGRTWRRLATEVAADVAEPDRPADPLAILARAVVSFEQLLRSQWVS